MWSLLPEEPVALARALRLFARHGAKVVIADVQSELGLSIAEKIRSETGQPVSYVHCNVANESDVENAVNATVSMHGNLGIMFNNAGISGKPDLRISSLECEEFMRVLEANLLGGALGAKHAARVMIPEKKGCILFSASVASEMCSASYPYKASKNAIVGLTKNLAVELGPYGIRVNCISPGGGYGIRVNCISPGAVPTPLVKGVGTAPGEMQLTLIPYCPNSTAKFLVSPTMHFAWCCTHPLVKGVGTAPGEMQLTLIPHCPNSTAKFLVSPTIAFFDAL
ncbi:hypothetical protein GH714_039939 [Hevea brasiliensis]|uniref:Uncharacterized protein n=1 Tax=Hevea brasiliensis TaxID=3981 RepID=A0A6A6M6S6_HEVBR|nr:hypothetical protein GH714_039939 [Hevea brasiliensis]